MKTTILVSALLAAGVVAATPVSADEGPWLVRVRALDLVAKNQNESPLLANAQVKAEDKVFPEVDFTYFFTPNIAAELILTYPQVHTVTVAGINIGSIQHLPPTLTAQYHFNPTGEFRPYVGLGVNYTRFTNTSLDAGPALTGSVPLTTDKDSFGLSGQIGADYKVADHWFINADAKYVKLQTDVKIASTGTLVTKLHVDPWLLSVGVGYRF